ncbi:hypothetical protein CRG98_016567 [Punica granatum]|uniref:Uncharacterized protein n=1 Tax=Punica granatum TaxID=22663 RepID=A0A2I0K4H9_PUNGR|nr:hypothetical protein CRG98_016567 [Punica granatum]
MEEPWAPQSLREVRDKVQVSIDRVFEDRGYHKQQELRRTLIPDLSGYVGSPP